MTKKNPKRSSQRKEQSERDKAKHLEDTSVYTLALRYVVLCTYLLVVGLWTISCFSTIAWTCSKSRHARSIYTYSI